MQAVLDEFAALTLDELYDYDEAAHPELPWYTGIIANRERNDLYYGFYDFDGNGVPELVIAAGDDSYQAPEAVYAFDGTKMVYLCKEQALGERATLSVMPDGTFVVRGSSGAAAGVCAIYRIAADGYSTDLLEVMEYEFSEDGTVTYTPQLVPEAGKTIGFDISILDVDLPCPGIHSLRMQYSSELDGRDRKPEMHAVDTNPSLWATLTFVD